MGATLSTLLLILAPVSAGRQETPPLPSVADAEASVRRAQQVLEAVRIFEAAERRRSAAESEVATARATLERLQAVPTAPPPAPAGLSPVKTTAVDPPVLSGPDIASAVPDAATIAAAQKGITTTTTVTNGKTVTEVKPYSPAALADSETNRQKFGGIEFGIGLAFSHDLGGNQRVRSADIVDGIVRVGRTDNVRARLVLESHYLFTPSGHDGRSLFGLLENGPDDVDCLSRNRFDRNARAACHRGDRLWGIGPFAALQPGTDNVIDAIGGGLMLALRRDAVKSDTFNIGLGMLYDVDTPTLADGFVENRAAPGTETTVRLRRGSQIGFLVLTSYSF